MAHGGAAVGSVVPPPPNTQTGARRCLRVPQVACSPPLKNRGAAPLWGGEQSPKVHKSLVFWVHFTAMALS